MSLLFYPAIYSWVSLCKSLPGYHPASEYADLEDQPDDELTVTVESWSDCVADFNQLARKDSDLGALLPLNRSAAAIPPCDVKEASPLLALAAGAQGNEQAQRIYDNMMDLANYRGMSSTSITSTSLHVCASTSLSISVLIRQYILTCVCYRIYSNTRISSLAGVRLLIEGGFY